MRVRLNLATKALVTHRRFLLTSGIIGGVAGLLFLLLTVHVIKTRRADAQLRTKLEQVRQEMAVLDQKNKALDGFFKEPENAKLHDRSIFLNGLIDERSFNWTMMFMDLEKILPSGVRVVSIEPKQVKGRIEVRIKVGAANNEAKLKFLKALEASQGFTGIQLLSELAVLKGDVTAGATDQLVLELSAIYART
jgi:type IV pilus assembly protein PilN